MSRWALSYSRSDSCSFGPSFVSNDLIAASVFAKASGERTACEEARYLEKNTRFNHWKFERWIFERLTCWRCLEVWGLVDVSATFGSDTMEFPTFPDTDSHLHSEHVYHALPQSIGTSLMNGASGNIHQLNFGKYFLTEDIKNEQIWTMFLKNVNVFGVKRWRRKRSVHWNDTNDAKKNDNGPHRAESWTLDRHEKYANATRRVRKRQQMRKIDFSINFFTKLTKKNFWIKSQKIIF